MKKTLFLIISTLLIKVTFSEGNAEAFTFHSLKATQQNKRLTDSATAILLTDVAGNTHHLGEILNQHKGGIFFIDFWASWCAPCIKEIPRLRELEKKYIDKIVFLSLSEDYRNPDWLTAIKKYGLTGNQYLMNYGSKNPLINELKLKTIPRFVLMTASGEILNANLPKPFEVERLDKIINKALACNIASN